MFVCKSISLANFLLHRDIKLIKIDKDKESSNQFLVFLFAKSCKLDQAMEEWRMK